ncbi:ABC transporter transmembrane domain-containing protein, partial [Mycobacterium marinum]
LRTIFFGKIIKLKTIFFDENDTGQLISRVVDDTTIINSFLSSKLPNVFPSILTFIGSLILLMVIDYQMTLISLISISLFILIIIPIGNIMHKISLKTQTETANFSAFLNKIFTEIRLVKVFNTEYKEIENSKKKLNNLYRLGVKEVLIESIITPVSSIVMLLTLVIIL